MLTAAKIIKIHDLESQKTSNIKRNDGYLDKIYSLACLGRSLVCAGYDTGGFLVWDTRRRNEAIFSAYDTQGYISDITGNFDVRKQIYLTTGEGTITGYDMRKLECLDKEPSFFDTSFQCVRMAKDKKLIVGTDSGMIYVFKRTDFKNQLSKMALSDDTGNRGYRGINDMELLSDDRTYVAACTDGKLRSFSYYQGRYQALDVHSVFGVSDEVESIHVNPRNQAELVVSGTGCAKYINVNLEDNEDNEGETPSVQQSQQEDHTKIDASESQSSMPIQHAEDYLNLF